MLNLEKVEQGSFLIIDKPIGITSHDVVDIVRRSVGVERVGHSGTLDKNVSGVLIIGIGSATRLLEYLLLSPKEYRCVMKIHHVFDKKEIQNAFNKFTGKIKQIPPIKSSVKRQERDREVYKITPIEFNELEKEVEFLVKVERGTYIRKLCHDIGEYLKTGAHMKELRRVSVGPFSVHNNELVNVYEFEKLCDKAKKKLFNFAYMNRINLALKPARELVEFMPTLKVDKVMTGKICNGQKISKDLCKNISTDCEVCVGSLLKVISDDGRLIAIGTLKSSKDDGGEEMIHWNKVFPMGI